jgi:hypothetical protein
MCLVSIGKTSPWNSLATEDQDVIFGSQEIRKVMKNNIKPGEYFVAMLIAAILTVVIIINLI